jgi:hypothetical protein
MFRHTFANRQLHAGVSIAVVSKLLGHGGISTTLKIYAHEKLGIARAGLHAPRHFSASIMASWLGTSIELSENSAPDAWNFAPSGHPKRSNLQNTDK